MDHYTSRRFVSVTGDYFAGNVPRIVELSPKDRMYNLQVGDQVSVETHGFFDGWFIIVMEVTHVDEVWEGTTKIIVIHLYEIDRLSESHD